MQSLEEFAREKIDLLPEKCGWILQNCPLSRRGIAEEFPKIPHSRTADVLTVVLGFPEE